MEPPQELPIRVMLVEDDPDMRTSLAASIRGLPGLELVFLCGTLRQALEYVAQRPAFDVLLTDLGLPDGSGLTLIERVAATLPEADIVVISVFGDDQHIFAALGRGATGYLLKEASSEAIVAAIQLVRQGGAPITPVIARRIVQHIQAGEQARPGAARARAGDDAEVTLTEREAQILALVSRGYLSQEIAGMLGLSRHTVFAHIKNIYKKLAVRNRTEAVFEAEARGLLRR